MRLVKKLFPLFVSAFVLISCGQITNSTADSSNPQDIMSENQTANTPDNHVNEISYPIDVNDYIDNYAPDEFNYQDIPAYAGNPVYVVHNNKPFFTTSDIPEPNTEYYGNLDDLGRCTSAYASVGPNTMPTEERGSIGSVKPSGWHTVKYNGLIDGNYLYNRCHLIAYELTAENANENNLVTGTRYMNVEGMLPYENDTAAFVKRTGQQVFYRSTPIFVADELVCRGVLLEAAALNSNGFDDTFYFCVFCYNVQPGITIDYQTGDSQLTDDTSNNNTSISSDTNTVMQTFIINTNTKKFHRPDCSAVKDIAEQNKSTYTGPAGDLLSLDFIPCKLCHPEQN